MWLVGISEIILCEPRAFLLFQLPAQMGSLLGSSLALHYLDCVQDESAFLRLNFWLGHSLQEGKNFSIEHNANCSALIFFVWLTLKLSLLISFVCHCLWNRVSAMSWRWGLRKSFWGIYIFEYNPLLSKVSPGESLQDGYSWFFLHVLKLKLFCNNFLLDVCQIYIMTADFHQLLLVDYTEEG